MLERVILRLLEPQREARYQRASAVRADLMQVAADLGGGTARLNRFRSAPASRSYHCCSGGGRGHQCLDLAESVAHPFPPRRIHADHGFADSATSPAFSPDGRLLTFIRGESTFEGAGRDLI